MMRAPHEAALPADAADGRARADDGNDAGGDDAGAMDASLARARDVIAGTGVRARIERAGHARDVLVVHAPPSALPTLHAASAALRALGFRYVTIDVTDA
ncbi:MAG: hypothetical protein ACREKM_10445 [Longimicrobiales bacterium]